MGARWISAAALGLIAAILMQVSPTGAIAKVTIRIGHIFPATHFEHEALLKLGELLAQRSGNEIEVKVFPANQLGTEREQTEQVDAGALECHGSGGAIQNYAPGLGVWSLPFMFRGPDHYDKVMDGPIGERFKAMLAEKSNIRILAFYPNGERMFFNNKRPFTKLSDFRGVKIRVDDQPISAQIWRALGANPVPMPFGELYTSLQTRVVDAGENPTINIIRMKFFEVAKFVTLTGHSLTTQTLMCNARWLQNLPEHARTMLFDAVKEIVPGRRKASWEADKRAIDELKALGVTVSDLDNRTEFNAALLPLYEDFGRRTGTLDLIKAIQDTK